MTAQRLTEADALADFVFFVRGELDADAREGIEAGPDEIGRVLARCDELQREYDL